MYLDYNFISGCMLGFEIVNTKEFEDFVDEPASTYVVIDLFIVRIVLTFN